MSFNDKDRNKKEEEQSINNIQENNMKEIDLGIQKKSDIQFPSSTLASTNNQDIIKSDIIKSNEIIPDFLKNNNNENNYKFNVFQAKKVELTLYKGNDSFDLTDKSCCYCTKTRCIKKYCECYSNNRYCNNCHCSNCLNRSINLGNEIPKEIIENIQIFCTCTKSNCNKKYCECYKSNQKCTEKCRCINCKNGSQYPSFNVNNTNDIKCTELIINDSSVNKNLTNDVNKGCNLYENKTEKNLEEEKGKSSNKKSNSRKSSLDSDNSFQIQRVSVYINKYQTIIDVEKFTKEMMIISKKRKKS